MCGAFCMTGLFFRRIICRDALRSHYVTPYGRTTSLPTVALRHSLRSHYVTPYGRTPYGRTPYGRTTSLPTVALRHSLRSHSLRSHSLRSHYVAPYGRSLWSHSLRSSLALPKNQHECTTVVDVVSSIVKVYDTTQTVLHLEGDGGDQTIGDFVPDKLGRLDG
jgi:hypothetical protein